MGYKVLNTAAVNKKCKKEMVQNTLLKSTMWLFMLCLLLPGYSR